MCVLSVVVKGDCLRSFERQRPKRHPEERHAQSSCLRGRVFSLMNDHPFIPRGTHAQFRFVCAPILQAVQAGRVPSALSKSISSASHRRPGSVGSRVLEHTQPPLGLSISQGSSKMLSQRSRSSTVAGTSSLWPRVRQAWRGRCSLCLGMLVAIERGLFFVMSKPTLLEWCCLAYMEDMNDV